jgi:lysophospholipid hydrolase
MSLSGYLPPLCDDGDMLVDGGYLNNLPGDIIRTRGGDTVIAVDVSSEDHVRPVSYGESLSGLYAIFTQWNPFSTEYIPSLADIQSRLAYVSCVKQLEDLKNMDGCIYLRPPVAHFGTMDFGKFDEIFEAGYQYGLKIVKKWEEDGTLSKWQNTTKKKKNRARRNSV